MIVVDADNGGKIGPVSFIGAAFLMGFYTDAAAAVVTVGDEGIIVGGGVPRRIISGGESRRIIAEGRSRRIIGGGK